MTMIENPLLQTQFWITILPLSNSLKIFLTSNKIRLGNSLNSTNKGLLNNANQNFNLGIGLSSNQPYGTIKRSNSNKKQDNSGPNDRPSTAPQKNDKLEERSLNPNGSMKRLPSPNVKCIFSNF